jgi:hypothetical protein
MGLGVYMPEMRHLMAEELVPAVSLIPFFSEHSGAD